MFELIIVIIGVYFMAVVADSGTHSGALKLIGAIAIASLLAAFAFGGFSGAPQDDREQEYRL